jgi:hypothetical protein
VKWLQKQMGHTTLAMTADLYGHFGDEARKQQIAKLEGAFNAEVSVRQVWAADLSQRSGHGADQSQQVPQRTIFDHGITKLPICIELVPIASSITLTAKVSRVLEIAQEPVRIPDGNTRGRRDLVHRYR